VGILTNMWEMPTHSFRSCYFHYIMHNTIVCRPSMPTMSDYNAIDLCSSSAGSEGNNHSNHSVVECYSESSYSDFVLPPYQTSSSSSWSSPSMSSSPKSLHSFIYDYLSDDSLFIPESEDCCDSLIESLADNSCYQEITARRPQRWNNR
jgi:hypothetical protein